MSREIDPADRAIDFRLGEAGPDCWSDVRSLHASAFRSHTARTLDPGQVDAFVDWVYSPDYTAALQLQDLQTAWSGRHLVGTAGWVPADDTGASARITAVFVSPLFGRLGCGRRLVACVEERARSAGFSAFAARVFPSALPFFEALGYARSSQGALMLGSGAGIPVTFVRKPPAPVRTRPDGTTSATIAGRGR